MADAKFIADELLKLHSLKEKGVITEEEFNEQKAALLGRSQKKLTTATANSDDKLPTGSMILLPSIVTRIWKGQLPLSTLFWGYYFFGTMLVFLVTLFIGIMLNRATGSNSFGPFLIALIALPYWILTMVGVWRSASIYAKAHKGNYWGLAAQVWVFLAILKVLLTAISLMTS